MNEFEEKLHKLLKENVNSADYNNWFSNLKIKELKENSIKLSVPNNAIKDWIDDKLFPVLQKCVSDIWDSSFKIIIESEKNVVQENKFPSYYNNIYSHEFGNQNLLEKYTFDNFVIGNSNRFAYAAAMSVAKNPGLQYNPLFIYGATGLGKTHLIQAIGNYITQTKSNIKILYLATEQLMNILFTSIQFDKNNIAELKDKIRHMDVLLLDDIHFIKNSTYIHDELFNIFNILYEENKQIVLTSDRLPREIPYIPERLVSRFQMGLIVDIKEPDFDTRLAILKQKTKNENLTVSEDILNYFANNIKGNVRLLEGALNKLFAQAVLVKRQIDIKLAREVVMSIIEPSTQYDEIKIKITSDEIIDVVLEFYKVSREDLLGTKRKKSIVIPRQICVYLLRKYTDLSLKEIAETMRRKDHSTIIHAVRKIEELIKTKDYINEDITRISSLLNVD